MLTKFFRKKRNMKIVLWIVALMIIPSFLIWGVNISGAQRRASCAAVVNKEPITLREFYARLSDVEENYRQIFGSQYSEIRDKLNIEESVLEDMIAEKLLLQQARKKRIKVFNNEIIEAVKSDPSFKNKDGKFDEAKYREIINNIPNEELKKIEDDVRKKITIEKLKNLVVSEGNVKVSDEEVEDYINKNNLKNVDKEQIRKVLLWQEMEKYFNDWYSQIRKTAKVEIYIPLKKISENKKVDEQKQDKVVSKNR